MAAKRLLGMMVPMFVALAMAFCSLAGAQSNDVSVTVGRTFVSTQTIKNPPAGDPNPNIHFGMEETIEGDYGRLLTRRGIFGISAELPVNIFFRMELNTYTNQIPKDIGALFVTPSVRVNFGSDQSVTPWVSAGGGYGRFREAPSLNYYGPNPGAGFTNTGVIQFGGGLDVWISQHWGAKLEVRDFYSGVPDLNVVTNRTRQHNFYVGVGAAYRF